MNASTGSTTIPSASAQLSGSRFANPMDLPRKAQARLFERIDLTRNRYKPLSILRAEARRVLDQFLDQDPAATVLTRSDRDKLIEDLIASTPGYTPLEDCFRDETIKEIIILSATQILLRRQDQWTPANARFRDDNQLRVVLQNWTLLGEPTIPGQSLQGGLDARLPNGFRVLALLPPSPHEGPLQILLVRHCPAVQVVPAASASGTAAGPGLGNSQGPGASAQIGGSTSTVGSLSGIYRPGTVATTPRPVNPAGPSSGVNLGTNLSGSGVMPSPLPATSAAATSSSGGPGATSAPVPAGGTQSGTNPAPARAIHPTPPPARPAQPTPGTITLTIPDKQESGVISLGATLSRSAGPNSSASLSSGPTSSASMSGGGSSADPYVRLRQRVTHRIINKLASAGVYDLNVIPIQELQKVIYAQVVEYSEQERLHGDESLYSRLALEILAGMNR